MNLKNFTSKGIEEVDHIAKMAEREQESEELDETDNPNNRLITQFLKTSVRKMNLYCDENTYVEVIEKLRKIQKEKGFKNHSEVFLYAIDQISSSTESGRTSDAPVYNHENSEPLKEERRPSEIGEETKSFSALNLAKQIDSHICPVHKTRHKFNVMRKYEPEYCEECEREAETQWRQSQLTEFQ